ncbi:MAG: DUF11 domain-containing protein [Betaproteobacteria bacterium]|nr:DUF11 domain-containing protein [Betaproteobacteria bacterium]
MHASPQFVPRRSRLRAAMAALALFATGVLFSSAPVTALGAPAAGTVIGNQATAEYRDAANTLRTATSNLVQTTVSQVKIFTLTANGARTAAAGQPVYYPHTITNTGNGTDTYALNAPTTGGAFTHTGPGPGPVYYLDSDGNGVPDNFTAITTSGPIAAAGIFRFVVAGTVPGGTANGLTGTMTVSATDTAAVPNTLSNTDTTTVANSAVNVTKSLSITSGPSPNAGPITVTLSYTNSGSAAATSLLLRDIIPAGMTYVANSGRWSVTGAGVVLTDLDTLDQGGVVYDFNVTTGTAVTATIASVPAGFSGNVTFAVSIPGGVPPGFVNNTAQFQTTTQAITNTNTASYQVVRVADVVANGSIADSTNGTGEPVTIGSAAAGSTFSFTNVIWNRGNAADTFVIGMAGQPSWPVGSTFTLLQSDGVTSLIANTTPSIPVYSGGCAAGFETDAANQRCGYRVILRVQLPVSATGGPYSITKTATSSFDNTKSDTVIDTLTLVAANSVDLTNNSAGGAAPGAGSTGTTVITTNIVTPSTTGPTVTRFRVFVNNTGAINDSFNLAMGPLTPVPAGWSVVFRADGGVGDCSTVGASLTNTGTINAGAARLICAETTVPITTSNQAAPGNYDLDFMGTSALNVAVTDVKRDRVTVNAVANVTLTPNNTQQTFPGGSVNYTHVLTNIGNAADSVTFLAGFLADSRSAQGWTSVAYLDGNSNGIFDPGIDDVPANQITTATTIPLAVNASRTVFVRVFAPGSAVGADPANVTTLTARYNAGAASVAATDSTSVSDGLVLLKEQRTINCDGTLPGTYTTAAIPPGPGTAPNMCLQYRITGTNTTAANITNVVISDIIPANTKQENLCGAPATSLGTIASPGTGASGTIVATFSPGTLTPAQSMIVTFCVRIDP